MSDIEDCHGVLLEGAHANQVPIKYAAAGVPCLDPYSAKSCSYPVSTAHGKCTASSKQPPVEIETDRLIHPL